MALTDNIEVAFLGDVNGSYPDATGNISNGTISGATYTSSGKINGCYDFDGNDRVDFVDLGIFGSSPGWSMQMWVNFNSLQTGTKYLLSLRGEKNIYLEKNSSNVIIFSINDGSTRAIGATTVSTSTWYHIVCTYSPTNGMRIYINGSLDDSLAGSRNPQSKSETNHIGALASTSNVDAKIDEVYFWSRELASTEATELYNSGAGLQYPFTTSAEDNALFYGTNF